tara:strand:- start:1011 stop:2801 length:1791 start_codon:yes stop_codon:yes gene_type:complete
MNSIVSKPSYTLILLLVYFSLIIHSKAETFTSDKTFDSENAAGNVQQKFNDTDLTLTISENETLGTLSMTKPAHVNEKARSTVIVETGASILGTANAVAGDDTDGLTVTNSGTIRANNSKGINLLDAINATVTNNSGGTIRAKTNTISVSKSGTTPDNINITNSGTIYSTNASTNTILLHSNSTNSTVTNNAGGHIYNESTAATITIGKTTTLTNSGKIENKKIDKVAITVDGADSTILLKDGGIIIGKIKNNKNRNTLKIQHGAGQGYYYETTGTDFETLQDLDGNPIVKGSAGSVGQGGSEILDELLSYKSLNIRKSLTRYKSTKDNSADNNGWGEVNFSTLKRKQNNQNLSLGFNFTGLGINLMNPYDKDKNFILSIETSKQNFTKNHTVNRYSINSGFYFPDQPLFNKFGNESYLLAGITLNDSDREILTNTTTSGKLDITDTYETFEFIGGTKINNNYFIPNLGLTFGFSHTPAHSESEFYKWDAKNVGNLSLYFDDDYKINFGTDYSFKLGWILDLRKMVTTKDQDFEVNNTDATHKQDNDLVEEITLAANLGFEKKMSDQHFLKFNIDSTISTQELTSFSGNFSYKFAF